MTVLGSQRLATGRALLVAACVVAAGIARAASESDSSSSPDGGTAQKEGSPSVNEESDFPPTKPREIIKDWNEYDLRWFTFKWGIYALIDYGTGFQNAAGRQQANVIHDVKPRDFRFSFSGKLNTERSITYTSGVMYDGPSNSWFLRETGIQIAIPELWGNVFIGRQKEGFSLSKISTGYALLLFERMPMNDAAVPILADGIKWLGVLPNKRANFNISFNHNFLPKNPSTGFYDDSFIARLAVLPMLPEHEGALLHLGVDYHWGKFSDGEAQLRSRPESFTAPFFLDTGVFPANHNDMFGFELYFRKGSWLFGTEYILDFIYSPGLGNPLFHGGEVFAAWVVTGEVRPYIDIGGKLGFITPNKSAFDGGPGALEFVLHASYSDFDSGPVQGGRFWRITPHVNWYLDSMVRLELDYGFGVLDRFGLTGITNFIQWRVMFMIQ